MHFEDGTCKYKKRQTLKECPCNLYIANKKKSYNANQALTLCTIENFNKALDNTPEDECVQFSRSYDDNLVKDVNKNKNSANAIFYSRSYSDTKNIVNRSTNTLICKILCFIPNKNRNNDDTNITQQLYLHTKLTPINIGHSLVSR